jgi:hypothetical protein
MQRMKSSSLVADEQGRLTRGGVVFSGLAYRVREDGLLDAIDIVDEGVVQGISDDWIPSPAGGGPRVDSASLQIIEDYGPRRWQGEPLAGIAYFFRLDGTLDVEDAYVRGYATDKARRAWYASGAPRQVVQGEEGTVWFEDGRLQAKGVGDQVWLNLVVGQEDGRLRAVILNDASLFQLDSVARLAWADDVSLVGAGIDATVLAQLGGQTGLRTVRRLSVVETSVGSDGVQTLGSLASLTTLWLSRNRGLAAWDVDAVRALRPDCVVHYEPAEPANDDPGSGPG